jgi:hypothetical protein
MLTGRKPWKPLPYGRGAGPSPPLPATSGDQQLRSHLASLRRAAMSEVLTAELERAQQERLIHTALLERLFAIEVAATDGRRLAARLLGRSRPSTRSPSWIVNWSRSCPRCAWWRRRPMYCLSVRRALGKRIWRLGWAIRRPLRGGGRRQCASSPPRRCSSSMSWATCPWPVRRPRRCSRSSRVGTYEGSIVLTTNRGIATWGQIFDDPVVATAMLDRLLHRSTVLNIEGESYRMRAHLERVEQLRKGLTAAGRV